MRIVYCIDSIRYIGGIQRVTVVKANALAEIPGNEIFILVADNQSGQIQTRPSDKVHFMDLGVNYYDDDWKGRLHVLHGILVKRLMHRKLLKKALRQIQPDVVIGVGQSEKNFLPLIKGRWKTVREFHFARNYRTALAKSSFDRILAHCGDWADKHLSLRKYDCIVTLTEEDRELNWQDMAKVNVVPNPSFFVCEKTSSLDSHVIISVGRLNYQKNFGSLIKAFGIVHKAHPDWRLRIVGEGDERAVLEKKVKELNLSECVELPGYSEDVREELLNASIFVLTSRIEGFCLAIVEAMECGLPVVSYACHCGPRDIITDGKDGFLVSTGDEVSLARKINQLIEDDGLRIRTGHHAKENAARYHADAIARRWMSLFKNLVANK